MAFMLGGSDHETLFHYHTGFFRLFTEVMVKYIT